MKTKLLIATALCSLSSSGFAATYGQQTTSKNDIVSDISISATDVVYGLYDTYGVTGGIAAGVTIDVTSNGSWAGCYGAYFRGTYSSKITDMGSIDGVVNVNAATGAIGANVNGLQFLYAQQADGAGISGQISAFNLDYQSQSSVYGVYLMASSIGDIGSSAVISAVNYYNGTNLTSTKALEMYNSSIGTIYGKISAEASSKTDTYAIYMSDSKSDLYLGGSALVEAKNDLSSAYAVFSRNRVLRIYGDNVGIQTFKGDIATEYYQEARALTPKGNDINIASGKFIFDNYKASTVFSAYNGYNNIIFASGVQADFVKSAVFIAQDVSLGADFIFHAKTLEDYTNMSTSGYSASSGTVYLETEAEFLMVLDKTFVASAGDYLDLLFTEGLVEGTFDEDNIMMTYADAENALVYGVDYTVIHNPEDDIYGRITFLNDIVIPEPSTYAAICGALVLAFAAYRRRK